MAKVNDESWELAGYEMNDSDQNDADENKTHSHLPVATSILPKLGSKRGRKKPACSGCDVEDRIKEFNESKHGVKFES